MNRIAFILPSLANQGPILVAKDLIGKLVKYGYQCKVYYFDDIVELEMSCPVEKISFFKKVDFNEYDIIHSHLFRPDLYCAINKWRFTSKIKLVTTIHTDIYRDLKTAYGVIKSKLAPFLWFYAWGKMDKVVVLSNIAKNNYDKKELSDKIIIINNGRDVPALYERISDRDLQIIEGLKNKYTVLGTVAAFDKRKGLEQIIELLRIEPNYAFVIVGDGLERPNLEKMALEYGIADRFIVLGRRPEGFRYIPNFDIYVMPSRSEGMPLAMLEAAALKTVIVCSDIPVFKEIFTEKEVSYFKLDNISSLKKACVMALENKRQMVQNAADRYMLEYTVERMTENYIKLFNSLK